MENNWWAIGASLLAGIVGAVCGWFGWLLIVLALCLAVDYGTGTAAALKTGTWSSGAARQGLWHKLGTIIAVGAAVLVDVVLAIAINNVPMELPFTYSVLISPVVVCWYILTELGSIVENAGALGAKVPGFLVKVIASLGEAVDSAGDKAVDTHPPGTEKK